MLRRQVRGALALDATRPSAVGDRLLARWLQAGMFAAMVHDLRRLLRDHAGRKARPTTALFDGRTLLSSPESGHRAGWDGACPSGTRSGKRKKGSKIHIAVDTLGHLLAAHLTPADEQDRAQVEALAATVQEVTAQSVELVYVDQGYTGQNPAEAAQEHALRLEVVKHTDAASCSCRWVVERTFAWATRFRRLTRDYVRLPETVRGLHFVTFACLMLH